MNKELSIWKKSWLFYKKNLLRTTLLVIGLVIVYRLNAFSGKLITEIFPSRPVLNDLFFLFTPYVPKMRLVSDLLDFIAPTSLGIYVLIYKRKYIDYYFFCMLIMYLARAIVVLFTPMGFSWAPYVNGLQDGGWFQSGDKAGFFFSGHTGIIAMLFFMSLPEKSKFIKLLMLFFLIVEVVALILARAHYSIDIFGAIVVTALIYKLVDREKFKTEMP